MTDWREHDGGPQPVGDDVWVEAQWPFAGAHFSEEPDEMEQASELPWEGNKLRYRILNQHLIDAKQAEIDALQHEVMWLHNALEQTEEAVVYGYTLLDDMDDEIDAARLEGIRLGLEAAHKAICALPVTPESDPERVQDDCADTIAYDLMINMDTIAREAVLDQITSEAQAEGVKYDKEADPHD